MNKDNDTIPTEAFDEILKELKRQPISTNNYKNKKGSGWSQTYGIVNRRCLPPDYSRQNWFRPYLYSLLLDFGKKYVNVSFNSITIAQNYETSPHKKKQENGFFIAFGEGFCLVYYTFYSSRFIPLPSWELKEENGKYWFYRDGVKITKQNGLPQQKRNENKMSIVKKSIDVLFD